MVSNVRFLVGFYNEAWDNEFVFVHGLTYSGVCSTRYLCDAIIFSEYSDACSFKEILTKLFDMHNVYDFRVYGFDFSLPYSCISASSMKDSLLIF